MKNAIEKLVNFKFTEKTLEGAGQYLVRTDRQTIEDDGYLSTILWKVGYTVGGKRKTYNRYCIISMSDGWVLNGWYDKNGSKNAKDWIFKAFNTIQDLVEYLNNNPYDNKWRMATKDEVLRVINYQKSRWLETL